MAYADQKMSGSRVVAIVIVALIHIGLGYAFVTGLALNFVKKQVEKLNTFDVQEPPPPPPDEPPPPPPPDQPMQPPPVVTPPPIVAPPVMSAPTIVSVPVAPPIYIAPPAPPAPPPPAPPRVSQKAAAKGNPGSWFSDADYPPAALRANAEGRTVVLLNVDPAGRVTGCRVTASSGNSDLDDTTCRLAQRRGRFTPAKDDNGNALPTTFTLPVKWQLPQ